MIEVVKTERGFGIFEFTDICGESCSIQESSIARIDAIWLGVNKNRMHLNAEIAKKLITLLTEFVETGRITCGVN